MSSTELGTTWYTLKLSATQARYEKVTRLVCPLGQSVQFTLNFTHYCKSSTDFAIRICQNVTDANNSGGSNSDGSNTKNANSTGAVSSNANKNHPSSDNNNSNSKNVVTITRVGQGMNLKAQATTRPKGQDMSA